MDSRLPRYFSVSQLTTFLGCARKYKFRYIERREPEHRSVNLAFGAALHSAVEWWANTRRETGAEPPLDRVHRIFRADWTAQASLPNVDFEDRTPAEWITLGETLLGLFTERLKGEQFRSSEERFEITLLDKHGEPLPVPFVGVYDLLGDGFIGEVKTAARKTGVGQWMLQLSAYSIAWQLTMGGRPRIRVIECIKTKVPKIEIEETVLTAVQEAWFTEVAVEAWRAIELGAEHPNPSWMCESCEYKKACRQAA